VNDGLAARPSLVALLYLLLSSPLVASVTLVDAYTQRSGLAEQLGLIEGKVLRKIEEAQAEPQAQTPRLTADQMERLRSAVKVAFAADRLRLAMRSHLDALLPKGDVELFVKWLDTPFGKRVTAIEVAGSTQEAPRRAAESAPQTLAELPTARKAELERILKASGVQDRTATMELNLTRAMALAAGMPVPDLPPAYGAQDSLEKPSQDRLEPYRRQIAIALAPTELAYTAAVYAPLSDDELRDYATVLERSSMRRVIEATNVAFDRALSAAAIAVGRRVGESTKTGRHSNRWQESEHAARRDRANSHQVDAARLTAVRSGGEGVDRRAAMANWRGDPANVTHHTMRDDTRREAAAFDLCRHTTNCACAGSI
jgi:hypothetical protein